MKTNPVKEKLRRGEPSFGTWLSFGSLFATLTSRGEVYFESIAMFVFFLLLARRYELRGKLRAADRLERLSRLSPRTAHRLDATGQGAQTSVGREGALAGGGRGRRVGSLDDGRRGEVKPNCY